MICDMGARNVIIKTAHGCVARFHVGRRQRVFRGSITPLEPVVSTVGSGDAFLAGFVGARFQQARPRRVPAPRARRRRRQHPALRRRRPRRRRRAPPARRRRGRSSSSVPPAGRLLKHRPPPVDTAPQGRRHIRRPPAARPPGRGSVIEELAGHRPAARADRGLGRGRGRPGRRLQPGRAARARGAGGRRAWPAPRRPLPGGPRARGAGTRPSGGAPQRREGAMRRQVARAR